MYKYQVKFYDGDYPERQEKANQDKAICYVEHHFNSKEYDDPKATSDNPILTVVAHNASDKSMHWAATYSKLVQIALRDAGLEFPLYKGPVKGVLQREFRERGDYNLRFTKMPAILVEPMWLSDVKSAMALLGKGARNPHPIEYYLAAALADSVTEHFPQGGLVAVSIGHKGKTSQPFDRGAVVTKDVRNHNCAGYAEADFSAGVLMIFEKMMTASPTPQETQMLPLFDVEEARVLPQHQLFAQILLRSTFPTESERVILKKLLGK